MTERTVDLTIIKHNTPSAPLPPSTLHQLFEAAAKARLSAAVVLQPTDEAASRQMAKRRHDLKASLRTLQLAVKALQGGYTFQDDQAGAKIAAIDRAVQVLEREGGILAELFNI